MFCNTPVCLHGVHHQGLTRDCHGSSFLVDFTHLKKFESRLRTTCSRIHSSFALLEHTTPSTHYTHTPCTCHTNTNTTPYHAHSPCTRHTHKTHSHTQNRPTHNIQFTVFGSLRFMLLLKTLEIGVVLETFSLV